MRHAHEIVATGFVCRCWSGRPYSMKKREAQQPWRRSGVLRLAMTLPTLLLLAAAPVALPLPLLDAHGVTHREREVRASPLTVFVFLATDCPICNRSIPDMNQLAKRYEGRVRFFGVSSERAPDVAKHDADYQLAFPTLIDAQRRLVQALGATTTPTFVVVSSSLERLYRGRLDDRIVDFGKERSAARREDLRLALDEALAGKSVSVPETPSIGCSIEGAHR
jgi:peroxiredoxin